MHHLFKKKEHLGMTSFVRRYQCIICSQNEQ